MTATLIHEATGQRHALLTPPVLVPPTAADPVEVHHASIARDDAPDTSAGGGVGREPAAACIAAVGEAIERYVATHATLPLVAADDVDGRTVWPLDEFTLFASHQNVSDVVSELGRDWFTEIYDLRTNQPVLVPACLVSMNPQYQTVATSSGLAADPDPAKALLRALQEVVERDAFMSTWLHQLGGRLVDHRRVDDRLGGDLRVYDLTPDFSPHPVALVTGSLDLAGWPRNSLGVACRSSWPEAAERAELEMLQGVVFAGHRITARPDLRGMSADRVQGFDEHAIYYTANPQEWARLPLHEATRTDAPAGLPRPEPGDELRDLVDALDRAGCRLGYRNLTTVDAAQLGMTVVRVLSPDLTPIHHDHRLPHLGGTTADITWRYADGPSRRAGRSFPSPFPHALG